MWFDVVDQSSWISHQTTASLIFLLAVDDSWRTSRSNGPTFRSRVMIILINLISRWHRSLIARRWLNKRSPTVHPSRLHRTHRSRLLRRDPKCLRIFLLCRNRIVTIVWTVIFVRHLTRSPNTFESSMISHNSSPTSALPHQDTLSYLIEQNQHTMQRLISDHQQTSSLPSKTFFSSVSMRAPDYESGTLIDTTLNANNEAVPQKSSFIETGSLSRVDYPSALLAIEEEQRGDHKVRNYRDRRWERNGCLGWGWWSRSSRWTIDEQGDRDCWWTIELLSTDDAEEETMFITFVSMWR